MPEPTTIEELRDWLARRLGWTYGSTEDRTYDHWHRDHNKWPSLDGEGYDIHPIDRTIDAAVLAMPEGWVWDRDLEEEITYAWKSTGPAVKVFITGHTPEAIRRDLLALARLAWIAEGAQP